MRSLALALCAVASAATYDVGPGQFYESIGSVPWATLEPGDTVLIHWREEPYREKWVICRQGTAEAPITVRGVANENGERPVIDGDGAVTAPGLNYWSEVRGIIKIGGANQPADTMPRYITIENLDIRGARRPNTYTNDNGVTEAYAANASTIYLEKGENIVIRNCVMHDSGNGLFVASGDSSVSRDILIERNYIYDNGNPGSAFEHNNYSAAIGIIFQYNRFGPPKAGSVGNNLKDRSAGLVVRYNWIEGGNRQLDLVDGEDTGLIRNDPAYARTLVYGNILIEPEGAGNRQIVHYGGDSGNTDAYRKGTLNFYNNTIVSTRTDRTTLFRLSTNDERADVRNNVFYAAAGGNTVSWLDSTGVLELRSNWIKPGSVATFGTLAGAIQDFGGMIEDASPGFRDEAEQDFRLAETSACIGSAVESHPDVMPDHDVTRQYVRHQRGRARRDMPRDIGARSQ